MDLRSIINADSSNPPPDPQQKSESPNARPPSNHSSQQPAAPFHFGPRRDTFPPQPSILQSPGDIQSPNSQIHYSTSQSPYPGPLGSGGGGNPYPFPQPPLAPKSTSQSPRASHRPQNERILTNAIPNGHHHGQSHGQISPLGLTPNSSTTGGSYSYTQYRPTSAHSITPNSAQSQGYGFPRDASTASQGYPPPHAQTYPSHHYQSQPGTPLGPPPSHGRPSPILHRENLCPRVPGHEHYRSHSGSSYGMSQMQAQSPIVDSSVPTTAAPSPYGRVQHLGSSHPYLNDPERERSLSVSPKTKLPGQIKDSSRSNTMDVLDSQRPRLLTSNTPRGSMDFQSRGEPTVTSENRPTSITGPRSTQEPALAGAMSAQRTRHHQAPPDYKAEVPPHSSRPDFPTSHSHNEVLPDFANADLPPQLSTSHSQTPQVTSSHSQNPPADNLRSQIPPVTSPRSQILPATSSHSEVPSGVNPHISHPQASDIPQQTTSIESHYQIYPPETSALDPTQISSDMAPKRGVRRPEKKRNASPVKKDTASPTKKPLALPTKTSHDSPSKTPVASPTREPVIPPGENTTAPPKRQPSLPLSQAPSGRKQEKLEVPTWAKKALGAKGYRLVHSYKSKKEGLVTISIKDGVVSRHCSKPAASTTRINAPPKATSESPPPWEPSILNITPFEDMTKCIADFIYVQTVNGNDPPPGGKLEIEAKLGKLIDRNTNDRIRLPVATECVINKDDPSVKLYFKSSMTEEQHRSYNLFLNEALTSSRQKNLDAEPRARVPLGYVHTKETDSFFELLPNAEAAMPPQFRSHLNMRPGQNRTRVRVTTDQKTKQELAKIIKVRLGDLDIHCPKSPFDCRISINMEIAYDGDRSTMVELMEGGKKVPVRNKDRMTYRHQTYQIDLTQVTIGEAAPGTKGEREHELEVELSADEIRKQGGLVAECNLDNKYEEMVRGFVDNVKILIRHCKY